MAGAGVDNFEFSLIGGAEAEKAFQGYNSQQDPTALDPRYMIRGSKNMFLTNEGTVSVRPGLKLFDTLDATEDGITSSFEFETVKGQTLPLRVLKSGKLQFLYEGDWHLLNQYDSNRFVFTTWWDDENKTTLLIFVKHDANLYSWSGAIADGVGSVNTGISILIAGDSPTESLLTSPLNPTSSKIVCSNNDVTSTDARSAIVVQDNPSITDPAASDVRLVINRTTPFVDGIVDIDIVTALSGIPSPNNAQVLLGATKEETTTNIFDFLNDPSNTGASNFQGITDTDTITAIEAMTYSIVPALEVAGSETWAELGFVNGSSDDLTPTIVVDGLTYSYSLIADRYLVNISGTPTTGELTIQGIVETDNTPDENFINDFCFTVNNQLVVGSETSRIIYFSFDENYTVFTQGNDLVSGDPDFTILDEFPVGGIAKGDSAYIAAGNSNWYVLTPNTPLPVEESIGGGHFALVTIKQEKQVGANNSAALAHEFIASVGEDIIYLSQDHQLRILGTLRNIVTPKTPSLSKAVRKELMDADFTGGALRMVDEFAYITSPVTGQDFLYQIRDNVDDVGNLTAQRYWQPPQERDLSRIAIIDGVTYGYSAEYPQLYQLWDTDQWHDDTPKGPAAYTCVMRMAYRHFKDRDDLGAFDKVYYEGYILDRSDLIATIYNDYQGATATQTYTLSDIDGSAVLYGGDGITLIGGAKVGSNTIGGGLPDPNYATELPKFRVIQNVFQEDCFEYCLELKSELPDSRWEILALGPDGDLSENNPVQLQKIT